MGNTTAENISTTIEGLIKSFISADQDIASDQDLSLSGLDSFSFVKLMVQIEMNYGIEIDDDSLLFEKLSTIERLVDLVQKHLSEATE